MVGWVAAAAILAVAFAVSPNFAWTAAPRVGPYAGDFVQEYAGGWIVRAGNRAWLGDRDYFEKVQHDPAVVGFGWPAEVSFPPIYPPFYYLWVAPLSRLDYRTAAQLWTALSVAALVAGVALAAGGDRAARVQLGAWVAASLCYAPVVETLLSGQKATFLLAIFAGTYRLLVWQRPALAGALFGCAAFKPQLVLVIALTMLAKRQWRFAAGMAATGAVLASQSLWVGWDPTLAWIAAALHPAPQPELIGRSHSWIGFARLLLGAWSGPAVLALALALVGATLAVLARGLRGPLDFAHPRFARQFAAMVVATALASPHLYTYDLTILVIPLFLAARELPSVPPATAAQRWMWLGTILAVFVLGGASTAIAERVPLQLSAVAGFVLLLVLSGARTELAPSG